MNREPPRKVYGNKRLKKTSFISRSIHEVITVGSTISDTAVKNNVTQEKEEFLFNKSQADKYQKHFKPLGSCNTAPYIIDTEYKKDNPRCSQKQLQRTNKDQGTLGIPLCYKYVKRNKQKLQPCSEREKNFNNSKSQEPVCKPTGNILHHYDEVVYSLPANEGNSYESFIDKKHIVEEAQTALANTFAEVLSDCPKFSEAATSAEKDLLKQMRNLVQKHLKNIESLPPPPSDSLPREFLTSSVLTDENDFQPGNLKKGEMENLTYFTPMKIRDEIKSFSTYDENVRRTHWRSRVGPQKKTQMLPSSKSSSLLIENDTTEGETSVNDLMHKSMYLAGRILTNFDHSMLASYSSDRSSSFY